MLLGFNFTVSLHNNFPPIEDSVGSFKLKHWLRIGKSHGSSSMLLIPLGKGQTTLQKDTYEWALCLHSAEDRHWKRLNHSAGAGSTLFPWCCLFRRGRKAWMKIFLRTITEIRAFWLVLRYCATRLQQYATVSVMVLRSLCFNSKASPTLHSVFASSPRWWEALTDPLNLGRNQATVMLLEPASGATKSATSLHSAGA